MMRRGMTLLECLLSLTFLSLVMAAGLGAFVLAGRVFVRTGKVREERQAVMAALDKLRSDVRRAGEGLIEPSASAAGLARVLVTQAGLEMIYAEHGFRLDEDAQAGASSVRISAAGCPGLAAGREIVLGDADSAEALTVSSLDGRTLYLDGALDRPHAAAATSGALVERIVYSLDAPARTLRRKVNLSTPQPVAEGIDEAAFAYIAPQNLFSVRVTSGARGAKGEIVDGFSLYPKNTGLRPER